MKYELKEYIDAGMDEIFIKMFGEKYAHAFWKELMPSVNIYFMDEPEKYIGVFLDAGADRLTIHAEANGDPGAMLREIHRRGARTGLAIKPGTGTERVAPWMGETDLILTMTVEPGVGGQQLEEPVLDKIAELRRMGYRGEIEADGGINEQNLPRLIEKGLSVAVMGTALFHAADPAEMMVRLHAMGAGVPEK